MSFSMKVFPEVHSVEVNKGPYGCINSQMNSDKKMAKMHSILSCRKCN